MDGKDQRPILSTRLFRIRTHDQQVTKHNFTAAPGLVLNIFSEHKKYFFDTKT